MKRPAGQTIFSGIIEIQNDGYFLKSGGLSAELVPAAGDAGALSRLAGQTVRITGRQTATRIEQARLLPDAPPAAEAMPANSAFAAVFAAIDTEGAALRAAPNVVAVRPGYRRVAGHLTTEPAVVVAVREKLPREDLGRTQFYPEPSAAFPSMWWPLIRWKCFRQGWDTPKPPPGVPAVDPTAIWRTVLSGAHMPEAAAAGQKIGYKKPKNVTLDACKVRDVLCHVGPDAGWPTLRAFLQDTQSSLTVTMYELTADHIVKELVALGHDKSKAEMALVLQENANETASVAKLRKAWDKMRFTYAKAVVSGTGSLAGPFCGEMNAITA